MLETAYASSDPAIRAEIGQLTYQRGEVRYALRDFAGALEDFERLVQQGYDQWAAKSGLIRSLSALGEFEQALAAGETTGSSATRTRSRRRSFKRRLEEAIARGAQDGPHSMRPRRTC